MEDALLSKNIALVRVHIESINQRIKTFHIFGHTFPWAHIHSASDIMTNNWWFMQHKPNNIFTRQI